MHVRAYLYLKICSDMNSNLHLLTCSKYLVVTCIIAHQITTLCPAAAAQALMESDKHVRHVKSDNAYISAFTLAFDNKTRTYQHIGICILYRHVVKRQIDHMYMYV